MRVFVKSLISSLISHMFYFSQEGQDRFLEEGVFKGYRGGFYVDVGAHDGRTFNNTLFFEQNRDWTGINIEPIPSVYQKLTANRPKSININVAVDSMDGSKEFLLSDGYTEMLSGIKDYYDQRHFNRLQRENDMFHSKTETVAVKTQRLATIFKEHRISRVNYLSVDVEGAEFEVIKSIDFDHVFIDVIAFENNYEDKSRPIVDYLRGKGYSVLPSPGITIDIFMMHQDSSYKVC